VLIVRCQNTRGRTIVDENGSQQWRGDALCLRKLGGVMDVDGRALRAGVYGVLAAEGCKDVSRGTEAVMHLLAANMGASFLCSSCRAFTNVSWADPGYETTVTPFELADWSKNMVPKVLNKQVEIK